MRITDLTIRGYGIFQDCRVEELPPGLCLFLGDNEAGKSTCLGFIRDVLFGAPDGRSRERSYPPLRGGRWGGSLGLVAGDGHRLLVDRAPGSKGGQLSITGPQGETLPGQALARMLGGTTREVFKNVYAFSLSELQTLETLSSDRVKDAIYSAGLGTGLSSLPDLLRSFEAAREKLFKSGGQRQRINALLSRLDQIKIELRQASGQIEDFDEIVRELEDVSAENERLKQTLSERRSRLSELKSLVSLWEEWIERLEIKRELDQLPDTGGFPEDGLKQYENLSAQLARLSERRDDLAGEIETLKQRLNGLVIDADLLEREQDLRWLAEEKSRFLESGEELQRLKPAITARQESLQAVIGRLGTGWSRQRIEAFDCSMKAKEGLARFGRSLQELENRVGRAAGDLEGREQELSRAEESLAAAEKELAAWEAEPLDWDEELAGELKRDRDRFAQALEELPAWRQERDRGLRDVDRFLTEIDPTWSRGDLEAFDTSLSVRERVEAYARDFAATERQLLQLDQELRSTREAIQDLEEKARRQEEALHDLERPRFESMRRLQETWSELKELRRKTTERDGAEARRQSLQDRIDGLKRGLEGLEDTAVSRVLPAAALAGLAGCGFILGLAGAGVLAWETAWLPAVILGVLVCSLSGLALFERRRAVLRRRDLAERRASLEQERQGLESELKDVRDHLEGLKNQIQGARERLGLSGDFGADALEAELEQSRELIQERRRLQERLNELQTELKRTRARADECEGRRSEHFQAKEALQEAWSRQLSELGLSRELEPAAAARLMDRVETARAELGHLREAEARLRQLEGFVEAYAAKAARLPESRGLSADRPGQLLSAVDRYLERVERERERLRNRQLAEKERDRKAEERDQREAERRRAAEELSAAEQALEAERSAWREWLDKTGLDPELTPELAREALSDIEKGQSLIGEQTELEQQQEQSRSRRQDFAGRVRHLAGELGRSEPEERLQVPFVEALVQELEASRADAGRGRELEEQRRAKDKALEETDRRIAQMRQEIRDLLDRAGADDEEAFKRQGRVLESDRQLRDRLQTLERSLLKGTGRSEMAAVEELFSAWSRQGLEEEIASLEQDIEEQESRRQEVSSRMGELRSERSRLATADDLAALKQEEESLKEELHQAALRWSTSTLAVHLLRKAKEKYEREQQPQVVRTAGQYLSEITGGAYTGVFAPLGENEVFAVDAAGQSRRPEELSRGTAEQLYLALRFGYVDNAGQQGERLPVIMDDILVNFDQSRAQRAAAAIAELAGRNQVLYFTCHRHTLELFRRSAPEAPVFELTGGDIQRRKENSC